MNLAVLRNDLAIPAGAGFDAASDPFRDDVPRGFVPTQSNDHLILLFRPMLVSARFTHYLTLAHHSFSRNHSSISSPGDFLGKMTPIPSSPDIRDLDLADAVLFGENAPRSAS